MGRPAQLPEDRFTSREIAVAADLPVRNFGLLQEQGLAPKALSESNGHAGHRTYDSRGLAHGALIGAIHLAGLELLVAARLAGALNEDFTDTYGRLPANLGAYLQSPLNPKPGWVPWDGGPRDIDADDDYWLHERLSRRTTIYRRSEALVGDYVLDIADHTFVLTRHHGSTIKIFSPVSGGVSANPEFRIIGRGAQSRIIRVHDEVDSVNVFTDPHAAEDYHSVERDYLKAHENAVTRLCINTSLAIRNALDRLADHRDDRRGRIAA